jgi:GNAT superfamily N-acetyltransferase
MTGTVDSVVTYLELRRSAVAPLAGEPGSASPFTLHHERAPAAASVAAMMYARVGAPWHWTDRLSWGHADWQDVIHREDVELWLARGNDGIVGYFQLQLEADTVELKYFGLVPECTGRGLGPHLLAAAIARAWALGRDRMTLNTCSLDHPAALPNYLKHGFVIVRTEHRQQVLSA